MLKGTCPLRRGCKSHAGYHVCRRAVDGGEGVQMGEMEERLGLFLPAPLIERLQLFPHCKNQSSQPGRGAIPPHPQRRM